MTSPTIHYYLTPISPWAYLGSTRFRKIAEACAAEVIIRVVDYGTIFPQTGGLPLPKRAPQRLAYRLSELKRWRDYLTIPLIEEPQHFPSKTRLTAYCIKSANTLKDSTAGLIVSEALMAGLWAEDGDMDNPQTVTKALDGCATDTGLSSAEILAYAQENSDLFDAEIARDTDHALAENVFGAPSYVLDGEVFWGQDRLDLLAWRLGLKR